MVDTGHVRTIWIQAEWWVQNLSTSLQSAIERGNETTWLEGERSLYKFFNSPPKTPKKKNMSSQPCEPGSVVRQYEQNCDFSYSKVSSTYYYMIVCNA